MKPFTILLPALVAAGVLFSPAVAHADPPDDPDPMAESPYYEETRVLDPVTCTWNHTVVSWEREWLLDPETFEFVGWSPWVGPTIVDQETELGTDEECADWSYSEEDEEWTYTPPGPIDPETGLIIAPTHAFISDVLKVGLA